MQVLIGADVIAANAVFDQRAGTEHEDRHLIAALPQRFAHGITAHARQHQVQDHQIERGQLTEMGKRSGAVAGDFDIVSLGFEVVLDADRQVVFVLDKQNALHGGVANRFAAASSVRNSGQSS